MAHGLAVSCSCSHLTRPRGSVGQKKKGKRRESSRLTCAILPRHTSSSAPRQCRIRDAAKDRPITDTDVQSDRRPLALPGHSHGAVHVRDAVAAALPPDLRADYHYYQLRPRHM
eukprot:scaffold2976_cov104-Isochrysis_galbana.AAC.2